MAKKSSKKRVESKAVSVSEPLIYVGPNMPGGYLQQYAVFKNGIPKHLQELFRKCPAAKSLCVTVSKLAEVDRAVAKKGTAEHALFMRAMEFVKKGGV